MNLNCDVVMDLVSIYADGLASPATEEAITAHLKTCPSCRKYYRQYDAFDISPASVAPVVDPKPEVNEHMKRYVDISLKLRRKRNFYIGAIASCACISAAAVLFGIFFNKDRFFK